MSKLKIWLRTSNLYKKTPQKQLKENELKM